MLDISLVCGCYVLWQEKIVELFIRSYNCAYACSAVYFFSVANAGKQTCGRKFVAFASFFIRVEILLISANITDIELAQVYQRDNSLLLSKHSYHIPLIFV